MRTNTGQKKESQAAMDRYFAELRLKLMEAGYGVGTLEDGKLSVTWQDERLCRVDEKGVVFFEPEAEELKPQLNRAVSTAHTVSEYMSLIESSPPLRAEGLTVDHRLLSEHNGIVLAAHPSCFGVEFATWEWISSHMALWQGHYTRDYLSAKEDYAVRSGLIQADRLFTQEQLVEVYRSVWETLDGDQPLTDRRRALLEAVQNRIEYSVPELGQRVQASNEEEYEYTMRSGQEPVME